MALDVVPPNQHPITYCMHESDWAVCKKDIHELKDIVAILDNLKLDNAVLKENVNNMKITVDSINSKLTDMEIKLATNNGSNKWIERIIWGIVGCLISVSFTLLATGKV